MTTGARGNWFIVHGRRQPHVHARLPRRAIWLAVALSASLSIYASGTAAGQDVANFTARSELVLLHVTVKDGDGRYLSGLPQTAFTVLDNGRLQPVRAFLADDAPATIGIVLDGSGSMQGNRAGIAAAAEAFVATSNPRDEVFALTFNERVYPVLPPAAPFTNNAAFLGDALGRVRTGGRSALFDALAQGLAYLERGRHERKVLIVVGDGGDNASVTGFEDVLRRVEVSNTVVYTVALIDGLERDANPKRLAKLSEVTGGEAFRPREARHLPGVFERIAADIRHAYALAFEPADSPEADTHRRIIVTAKMPGHGRLRVRTRSGYLRDAASEEGAGDR